MNPSADAGSTTPAAVDPHAFILDLMALGRAAAACRDLAGWRAAHARSADRDLRLASVLALDDVLRDETPRRAQAPFALVAARAALDDLRREPYEPARWALLARLCATLGFGGSAAACDAAARRLEPGYGQDLVAGTRFSAARPTADEAAALADAVRAPEARGRISVAMIVKDEERMLPDCLRSLTGAVDEIVVVDTGSSDRTVEIAARFGAVVLHRPWDGSFANARNAALDAATGDWALVLDADERLLPADGGALRSVLGKPWRTAAQVEMIHATRADGVGFDVASSSLRLWRHLPSVRYEGIVHEQVGGLPRYLPDRFEALPVRVLHEGYRDELVIGKDKFERNRRLLEEQVEHADGRARPFALYNLGVEHLVRGSAADARTVLERAVDELERFDGIGAAPWGPMLALRVTSARRIAGAPEAAERDAARWLELFPDHTDLAVERAQCAFAVDPERGLALLEEALGLGDGPARYNSIVGGSTYLGAALRGDYLAHLGRDREAVASYRAGLAANPDYVAGIGGLARSLLRLDTAAADVLAELHPFASKYIEAAGGLLGTAFLNAGAAEQAQAVFAELLSRHPGSLEARVGLASCSLAQGDTAAATGYCTPLPADPEEAAPLVRCAVFAALLDGDAGAASAILDGPAGPSLPPGQIEAFAAWRGALAGEPAAPLSDGGADAALGLLGTTIQLARLDACDVLYRLVVGSELSPEDARDGVAERFFDGGYHDIAAEEWLALVDECGPVGCALLGLARVAHAKEQHDDAMALAAEAARVDPSLAHNAERVSALAEASAALVAMGAAR